MIRCFRLTSWTALLVLVCAQSVGVADVSAKDATVVYDDPSGLYRMQLDDSWSITESATHHMIISNELFSIIPGISLAVGDDTLSDCLDWVIKTTTGLNDETTFPLVAQTATSWRSWIAYENGARQEVDYFECQVSSDTTRFFTFVGNLQLADVSRVPEFADVLGKAIVQPESVAEYTLIDENVSAELVFWTRGPGLDEMGLSSLDGKEWIVAVLDLSSTDGKVSEIPLKALAVRAGANAKTFHASTKYSRIAASALSEEPAQEASTVAVPSSGSSRIVAVFSVAVGAGDITLAFGSNTLALPSSLKAERLDVLRPPHWAAAV